MSVRVRLLVLVQIDLLVPVKEMSVLLIEDGDFEAVSLVELAGIFVSQFSVDVFRLIFRGIIEILPIVLLLHDII